MAIASIAVVTTNSTAANANTELIAGASKSYKALEVGFSLTAATAGTYGMGIPAAIGVTPATTSAPVFEDGGNSDTAASLIALSWGTSPTSPTVFSRRVVAPATVGAGICWTFPRGFQVLKAKSLVTFNILTPTTLDLWWVLDE